MGDVLGYMAVAAALAGVLLLASWLLQRTYGDDGSCRTNDRV
jgi:hypothetical protein